VLSDERYPLSWNVRFGVRADVRLRGRRGIGRHAVQNGPEDVAAGQPQAGAGVLRDEALVITQRGRAVAIVITAERWNSLQDELDELRAETMLVRRGRSVRDEVALLRESDRRLGRSPSWG
jgi:antitoxin (DNA-binding transcriptional repressor) of toxin-antitoxin stability system